MLNSFSKRLVSGRAAVPALCLVLGMTIWQHPAIAQTTDTSAKTTDTSAPLEEVRVTGSRVITDGTQSPTPLTVVASDQLLAVTPSNLADGLNKLPQFSGSQGQAFIQNASSNSTGNFLNLRSLGVQRTLVLFDGDRMPPTAANGTVDVNTLPQMLVQRVDVVTGGASAVYGSTLSREWLISSSTSTSMVWTPSRKAAFPHSAMTNRTEWRWPRART